jgi:hypothetical protein
MILIAAGFVGIAFAGLDNGLVAYYPFTGNADDESGNGNHGIVYGATLSMDKCEIQNRAYSFDGPGGEDEYIEIPYNEILEPDIFSISIWMKSDDIPTNWAMILSPSYGFGHGDHGYGVGP